MWDTILQSSEPAALAIVGLYDEAVQYDLRNEAHHMSVRNCPQQLQVESTIPDGVICSCLVQEY